MYSSRGDYDKALDMYENSLAILDKVGHPGSTGETLCSYAVLHQARGDSAKAIEMFLKTLQIFERVGMDTREPKSGLAYAYLELGKLDEAEPYVKGSEEFGPLARLALLKGDYRTAKANY